MPELPEVETIRRQLVEPLTDAVVVDAWAFESAKFTPALEVVGSRLAAVRRRGKYLIIDLADSRAVDGDPSEHELIVHLGMTGRLGIDDGSIDAAEDRPHLRARWWLDDGRTLSFDDTRRFGRIAVVSTGDHGSLPTLASMGPEPFDDGFSAEHLRQMVNRSSKAVKTQLLSQRIVAGVGNIYADEALWRSRVHPGSRRLTRAGAVRLRDSVRQVLAEGIEHGGTTLRDYRDATGGEGDHQNHLDCYGRAGLPCRRCGEPLRRTVIDARSTVHCAVCQRRGGTIRTAGP